MPTKKNSTTTRNISNDLEDGEKVIITEKREISKNKIKKDEEYIDAELISDDYDFDDETDDEQETTVFAGNSIGALLFESDAKPFEDDFVSIIVTRLPDSHGEKYKNPNSIRTKITTLKNYPLVTDPAEIEEQIQNEYFGGSYNFQIRHSKGFSKSWNSTLSDPHHAKSFEETNAENKPAEVQQTNSFESTISLMASMKDFFGIDRQNSEMERQREEMRKEIDRLKDEKQALLIESLRNEITNSNSKSDLAIIVEKITSNSGLDKDLKQQLLDSVIPEKEDTTGLWGTVKYAFQNPNEVKELLSVGAGIVLPMLTGTPGMPGGINPMESLMKMQPPPNFEAPAENPLSDESDDATAAAETPVKLSGFKRKTKTADKPEKTDTSKAEKPEKPEKPNKGKKK